MDQTRPTITTTMTESTPIYDQMVKEMTEAFTKAEAAKHTWTDWLTWLRQDERGLNA